MTAHKRVLVIQGHPDSARPHLCHALAEAYADGASGAGHEIRRVDVGALEFPLLKSQHDWETGAVPAALEPVQASIAWAEHIVLVFPLWLGDMPALVKAFLEQVARPGFAFGSDRINPFAVKPLKGRSARVVVTMGMPALVYRWFYGAHAVKSLERNILAFIGMGPVARTLIGMVGGLSETSARRWLRKLRKLGERGA